MRRIYHLFLVICGTPLFLGILKGEAAPLERLDLSEEILQGLVSVRKNEQRHCKKAMPRFQKGIEHPLLGNYSSYWLARCSLQQKSYDQAIQWAKKTVEDPSSPLFRFASELLALAYYEKGKASKQSPPLLEWQEARKWFRVCCNSIPKRSFDPKKEKERKRTIANMALLASIELVLGNEESAKEFWKKIAVQAYETDEGSVARKELELRNASLSAQSLFEAALSFLSVYEYGEALKILEPLHQSIRQNLGQKPGQNLGKGFGENEGEKALAINVQIEIAKIYFALRDRAHAKEILETLFEEGSDPLIYHWLARSYAVSGEEEKAIQFFQKLARKYPRTSFAGDALFRAGGLSLHRGEGKQARTFWVQLLDHPGNKGLADSTLWFIGWSYYLGNAWKKAQKWWLRLETEFSTSTLVPQARYWRAVVHHRRGEVSKAVVLLKSLEDTLPLSLYHFLASQKLESWGEAPLSLKLEDRERAAPRDLPREISRIQLLLSKGLKEEGIVEIDALLEEGKLKRGSDILLELSNLYQQAGEFHQAYLLAEDPLFLSEENFKDRAWLKRAYPQAYSREILAKTKKHELDPFLIFAIMRQESAFAAYARSPSGALGLLQLMPSVIDKIPSKGGVQIAANDLLDPSSNIKVATSYLHVLSDMFKHAPYLVIPTYNAGEEPVKVWVTSMQGVPLEEWLERIPYRETRIYFRKVLLNYAMYHLLYGDLSKFYAFLKSQ